MRNEWIKVSDYLPEEETEILCYFADGKIETFTSTSVLDWNKRRVQRREIDVATHWMPFPSAPKEDT